jgi:hypothetical protein
VSTIPRSPAGVVRLHPSAAARRRARRDADLLTNEIIAALVAFKAGDAGAVHAANWRMARLMGCVFAHQLDIDDREVVA